MRNDHDFFTVTDLPTSKCILAFGASGTGKTTFALSGMKNEIAFFDFDGRSTVAVIKAQETYGRVIRNCQISAVSAEKSISERKVEADSKIAKFFKNFYWALDNPEIQSISIDTATELERIFILSARNGRLKTPKNDFGSSKGEVNLRIQGIFERARAKSKNLIVLARESQQWADYEPINKFNPRCSTAWVEFSDWVCMIRKAEKIEGNMRFSVKITKAGTNIAALGNIYTSDDWGGRGPFDYISEKLEEKILSPKIRRRRKVGAS